MDLVEAALPVLLADGAQFALLGNGDPGLEQRFVAAARAYPGRAAAVIGYDESLAHLMQGGVDTLLVPSRFEPCGLTQLCALRYGAIPIVSHVGGLADTVIDANEMALAAGVGTGIVFAPVTAERLALAIGRALELWRAPASWQRVQSRAMATDVGWTHPAQKYAALYRELCAHAAA
jgi:starch synthase